jgi:hypothetical protein
MDDSTQIGLYTVGVDVNKDDICTSAKVQR